MNMKTSGSWRYAVIGLAVICLTLPAPIFAQETETPAKVFKQEELDQLLAPIALYPDNVLTQILVASTYPLEVVQAERWMKQNKSLKGDAMNAALEKQSWDDSVKALVPFPRRSHHDERKARLDPETGRCVPGAAERRHGHGAAVASEGGRGG